LEFLVFSVFKYAGGHKLDLSSIPIIDTHSHAFLPEKEEEDFRIYFNLGLYPPPTEIAKNTLVERKIIHDLRKILGLPIDADQQDIVECRNKIYRSDPKEYVKKLMGSYNIEKIIIDQGFPNEYYTGYGVDLQYFADLFTTEVFSSYRMDVSLNKILEDPDSTFEKAVQILDEDFNYNIKTQKAVAVKTLIAYQTGLEIKRTTKGEAAAGFNRFKKNPNEADEKIIRDYFFAVFLKKCIEMDFPMQVHTGYGSPPLLNLLKSNPILLQGILSDKDYKEAKVILVHSGYPYSKEAGFMTSVFPNCYVDVSVIPYYGIGYKKALMDLFELAPFNRILFATDGASIPETYWFGYANGIKTLEEVLVELSDAGWLTKAEIFEFAEMILNKNAKEVFVF